MTQVAEVDISVYIWPGNKHNYCVYGYTVGDETIDKINQLDVGEARFIKHLGPDNFDVLYDRDLDKTEVEAAELKVFKLIALECPDQSIITIEHKRLDDGMTAPKTVSSATAAIIDNEFELITEAVETTGPSAVSVPKIDEDLLEELLTVLDIDPHGS